MKLAKAFDWHGHRCERSVDLRDTLEQAFIETGQSLVVIPIDYAENQKLTERLGNIICPT
jgi:acetolactate synthase-1/2/3 large subunit